MARCFGGRHHTGMRRHYTDEQRTELVDLVTAGRTTTAAAADRFGVRRATAYYWVKQWAAKASRRRAAVRPARSRKARAPVPTTFVQLVRSGDLAAAIGVRVGGAEVQVRRGFDAQLLRSVVEALGGGAA